MNKVKDILLGIAVGDSLGVPVEFKSRSYLKSNQVKGMMGYGTHYQPAGTWSDDSSLTFCLAESLTKGYNLVDISKKIISWHDKSYWTAYEVVFDCGITTGRAIDDLREIISTNDENRLIKLINEGDEFKNGNGSLMRISPLLFEITGKEVCKQFEIIKEVSGLTHRHIRSALACFIFLKWMENLLEGKGKAMALKKALKSFEYLVRKEKISNYELEKFLRIQNKNFGSLIESEIHSSGYVIHSLEASIWCVLNTESFSEAVLKAVNLGDDTDTTGAIVGAVAGLIYGCDQIPKEWLAVLARLKDIIDLSERLNKRKGT